MVNILINKFKKVSIKMDSCFGVAGMDWVLIVTDTAVNRSIFTLKDDEDKIVTLNNYKILGMAGDCANRN